MKRRKARATFAAYITIKGLGGFQEKFISELITNDIQIYEICQGKDGFTAVIKPYSYLKTARIARKHGIRLNVTERQGFIFRLLPLRKRWGACYRRIVLLRCNSPAVAICMEDRHYRKQRGHRHTDMCRDGEKRPYARLQQEVF